MRIENRESRIEKGIRRILRVHVRSPLTTGLAVLTIGLGVGANTALFSAVRAVLLRPLPYAEPERLVMIWEANEAKGLERQRLAPARVADWQQAREVFSDRCSIEVTGVPARTGCGASGPHLAVAICLPDELHGGTLVSVWRQEDLPERRLERVDTADKVQGG